MKSKHVLLVSIPLVLIAWFVSYPIVDWFVYGSRESEGQFGDSFGAVNALFSGLAFALLIYTAMLQREDLLAQQEQLKAQLDEMKEQRILQAVQTQIQHGQLAASVTALQVEAIKAEITAIEIENRPTKNEATDKYQHVASQIRDQKNLMDQCIATANAYVKVTIEDAFSSTSDENDNED